MLSWDKEIEAKMRSQSVLKWPGSKWTMTQWLSANAPEHDIYAEACFGSGAFLFAKTPVRVESVNDKDDQVVNLFRVCRDRPRELIRAVELTPVSLTEHHQAHDLHTTGEPVEDARRLLVRAWQSFGGRIFNRAGWRRNYIDTRTTTEDWNGLPARIAGVVQRLKNVAIDCEDATKYIQRFKRQPDRTLIYVDPPYPLSVRSDKVHDKYYRTEMLSDEEHLALLDALDAHPAMIMLSGYRCELYDRRLTEWRRVDRVVNAQMGQERTESIWLNKPAAARAGYQMSIFDVIGTGQDG